MSFGGPVCEEGIPLATRRGGAFAMSRQTTVEMTSRSDDAASRQGRYCVRPVLGVTYRLPT